MNTDLIIAMYKLLECSYVNGVIEDDTMLRSLREWGVSRELALWILRELKEERKQKGKER